jgi:hypothetical protein
VAESKAEGYRRMADECRVQAEKSARPEDKASWLSIAAQWQLLAESVDSKPSRNPQPKT